jgi:hypothetical protein
MRLAADQAAIEQDLPEYFGHTLYIFTSHSALCSLNCHPIVGRMEPHAAFLQTWLESVNKSAILTSFSLQGLLCKTSVFLVMLRLTLK